MASALEEPTMRKTLGLCFLALTLTAATAHAQGLFLEKGEPGTSAAVGGAAIGTGWSASVVPSYTYRGMFDVGVDLTWYGYNNSNSDASKLSAIGAMPFVNVYFIRAGDDTAKIALPVSVSGTLGVEKRMFTGNGLEPNPDGWGLLLGGSLFRRMDFSNTFAGIPEIFIAYDLQATTWHSAAAGANAAVHTQGQTTEYDHKARAFLRANMAFRSDKILYTIVPYVGYQAGFAVGGNLGAIF
jgi:hypothetical protein